MSISLRINRSRHPSIGFFWPKSRAPRLQGSRSATAVGLDIGTTAVKAVAVRPGRGAIRITGFAIVERPGRTTGDTDPSAPVAGAITKAVTTAAPDTRRVALAIADQQVLSHRFEVPGKLDERAIGARAALHIDTELQQSIAELHYDYRCRPMPSGAGKHSVSLVAARCESIEALLKPLHRAGLACDLVDVESHALARVLQRGLQSEDACAEGLVDLGTKPRLAVIDRQDVVFQQTSACRLNTESSSASHAIKQALALYQSNPSTPLLKRLWLLGGRAKTDLAARLSTTLAVPVRCLDEHLHFEPLETLNREQLQAALPRLMTALGLALHLGDPDVHWR